MKKFVRRVIGLALALVLVCGSGLSARAATIRNLSGKEFISGSNGTIDQYVNDIAPRHVAVLAQFLVLTGAFSISSDLFYIYMDPNSSSYRTIEVVAAAKSDGTKLGIDVGGTTMYWSLSLYDIH